MRYRKGQSLVETTLILTAFFGLLFGVVNVGQTLVLQEMLTDRVRSAVRWGVMHPSNSEAIRNVVLYGVAEPSTGDGPFFGLRSTDILVHQLECPGPNCRLSVSVANHGMAMSAPLELKD